MSESKEKPRKTCSLELKIYDGDNLYGTALIRVELRSKTPAEMRLALINIAKMASREQQPRDELGRFLPTSQTNQRKA